MRRVLCVCAVVTAIAVPASAQLYLDFGTGAGYVGDNFPEALGEAAFTRVSAVDGLGLDGIVLDMGRNTSTDGDKVQWDQDWSADPAAAAGGGIFATDLTSDGMTSGADSLYREPIGLAVDGLDVGSYRALIVAHHGGNSGTAMNVFAGIAGTGINTLGDVYANNPVEQIATLTASNTASWQEGNNYAAFDFEITPTRSVLYLAVDREPDSQNTVSTNATLSGLIIVPEPATLALLVASAGLLFRRRR